MNPTDFDQHFIVSMIIMVVAYHQLRKAEETWRDF